MPRLLFFVLAGDKLFLLFDHPFLKPADDVQRLNDYQNDEQDDLHSLQISDQLLDTGCEGEAESCKQSDPNKATGDRQRDESEEAEMSEAPEHRARGSKAVHVLH